MLDNFPFRDYLYPHALDTIDYLNTIGEPVILSDGDPTFQPLKISKSGIAAAVHGRVLVVVHKEDELDKVFDRYPAGHYVAVDDKPRIVAALERECPTTFTTVLVEQGKYAEEDHYTPAPDIVVAAIADLRDISRAEFLHPHPGTGSAG
jgi:FMN phosphatase YigB (HAD superfamily)